MANIDGRQVMLRYELKQGQKLAIVRPPVAPVPVVPIGGDAPEKTF